MVPLRPLCDPAAAADCAITFGAGVACALLIGWLNRGQDYLTPESGVGYRLGIAGAGLMLMLLLYPLRKRAASLRVSRTIVPSSF
jgi:hypothetical protein